MRKFQLEDITEDEFRAVDAVIRYGSFRRYSKEATVASGLDSEKYESVVYWYDDLKNKWEHKVDDWRETDKSKLDLMINRLNNQY